MDTKAIEARARRLAEQAKPGIVKRDGKIFRGAVILADVSDTTRKVAMCIHISVKRWKDKVNGNSYFSGLIFRDGQIVARMPFQYGYGSQPDAVAAVELRSAGVIPDKGERFNWAYATSALREAGIPCTYDEAWTTKRECKAHVA